MTTKGKILITGGTGYIGSHTSVALIEQGYKVVIIDNLSNSDAAVLQGIKQITGVDVEFHQFDLLNQGLLNGFFEANKNLVGIIHFAASKAVGESMNEPLHYYRNNLMGLVNLLECMKQHGQSNVVFSSSCTVYGQPDVLPVNELSPIKPAESPYGYTKQVNENILRDTISAVAHIKGIALRYFNPIGAHDSGLIGELPKGSPANLMPFITQTAYGIRKELSVFGQDYDTPDGSCIRDYIHVMDLADAHIVALERLVSGTNKSDYELFNIGTGNGYSVLELIRSFEQMAGQQLNYKIVGRRAGDIEKIWADTTIANNELGWTATRTLDQMTASAWAWENKYRAGSK